MEHSDEIDRLKKLFMTRYAQDARDISYTWHPRNPVSVYYRQVQERSIVTMLNQTGVDLGYLRIIDVGCGSGSLLRYLSSLGYDPSFQHGVDLIYDRILASRRLGPETLNLSVCDAQRLPYPDECFDVACLFTVLSSVLDAGLRMQIANEIIRLLKAGGYLIWYDMCYSKSVNTRAIKAPEIATLFPPFKPIYQKKLHFPWISKFAKHSFFICDVLDRLPGIRKTHNFYLLQKVGG